MNTSIIIRSSSTFQFEDFFRYMEVPAIVLDFISELPGSTHWYFHIQGVSTTLFAINYDKEDTYEVSIDNMASYNDLRFFPYLVDSLTKYLKGENRVENIYKLLDEEWVEETIAEEIAYLKATLSATSRYFIAQPIDDMSYVSLDALYDFGVNLHSSTPRIYGYIQYMMRNHLLPCLDEWEDTSTISGAEQEIEVDVPQHVSIGKVKSWQLDGSETYESYSKEDVDHLLSLASDYRKGKALHGVVLNDIGTIHQEGVGMEVDGEAAIHWFTEAYKAGDSLYAPTNLGDLYRKGCGIVKASLTNAFQAYRLSTDPYAHYRIGQAYEEGWIDKPDMQAAMKWYRQAAEEGHHLAIKRMKKM